MDSKKKFQKNRYWKTKYQPRNPNNPKHAVKATGKKVDSESESEESESSLKQPLPSKGWFFEEEEDPSSTSEEYEQVAVTSNKPSIYEEPTGTNLTKVEEKLLLSLDYKSGKKNIIVYGDKVAEVPEREKFEEQKQDPNDDFENLVSGLKTRAPLKSVCDKKRNESTDSELDFLLSLEEPVHSGSTDLQKHIENERKVKNSVLKETNKSNDLEKWLDSVLDA